MRTILENVDAVRRLTLEEQAELFRWLAECGIRPHEEAPAADASRYKSEEFTHQLTECFRQAKRRAGIRGIAYFDCCKEVRSAP
ncbi:MAG: hypothetical protein WAN69_10345, partial [Candidatus Korobacteraceae bacterium]